MNKEFLKNYVDTKLRQHNHAGKVHTKGLEGHPGHIDVNEAVELILDHLSLEVCETLYRRPYELKKKKTFETKILDEEEKK